MRADVSMIKPAAPARHRAGRRALRSGTAREAGGGIPADGQEPVGQAGPLKELRGCPLAPGSPSAQPV